MQPNALAFNPTAHLFMDESSLPIQFDEAYSAFQTTYLVSRIKRYYIQEQARWGSQRLGFPLK